MFFYLSLFCPFCFDILQSSNGGDVGMESIKQFFNKVINYVDRISGIDIFCMLSASIMLYFAPWTYVFFVGIVVVFKLCLWFFRKMSSEDKS